MGSCSKARSSHSCWNRSWLSPSSTTMKAGTRFGRRKSNATSRSRSCSVCPCLTLQCCLILTSETFEKRPEEDIRVLFSECGEITSITWKKTPTGFMVPPAFVTFDSFDAVRKVRFTRHWQTFVHTARPCIWTRQSPVMEKKSLWRSVLLERTRVPLTRPRTTASSTARNAWKNEIKDLPTNKCFLRFLNFVVLRDLSRCRLDMSIERFNFVVLSRSVDTVQCTLWINHFYFSSPSASSFSSFFLLWS